jgi:hypothetical protein
VWRALTENERALLDALLSNDFPGVEPLRVQAHDVLAAPGCRCGCGTIDLCPQGTSPPGSAAASPVPAEGRVLGADGVDAGGLLLFLSDGRLASLEVYSYDDPLPLPRPDRVIWC